HPLPRGRGRRCPRPEERRPLAAGGDRRGRGRPDRRHARGGAVLPPDRPRDRHLPRRRAAPAGLEIRARRRPVGGPPSHFPAPPDAGGPPPTPPPRPGPPPPHPQPPPRPGPPPPPRSPPHAYPPPHP